jgi:hypothetical protein
MAESDSGQEQSIANLQKSIDLINTQILQMSSMLTNKRRYPSPTQSLSSKKGKYEFSDSDEEQREGEANIEVEDQAGTSQDPPRRRRRPPSASSLSLTKGPLSLTKGNIESFDSDMDQEGGANSGIDDLLDGHSEAQIGTISNKRPISSDPLGSIATEEDDLLGSISQENMLIEICGPPVNTKLADIINIRFSSPLNTSKLKEKQEKYLRPENCNKLMVPDVNTMLKGLFKPQSLLKDKGYQYIQQAITKVACVIAQHTQGILSKTPMDTRTAVTALTDALAMLGHAHLQLSHKRREQLVYTLKPHYKGLNSPDVPITTNLFGDDIVKTLGDVKKAKQLQQEAKQPAIYNNSKPKNFYGPRDRQFPFKSQSRGQQYKKGPNFKGRKAQK